MESLRQFDLCRNRDTGTKQHYPLLIVLRHGNWSALDYAAVAPIRKTGLRPVIKSLEVPINFDGGEYVVEINKPGTVQVSKLGHAVGNAGEHRDQFIRAIDLLYTGF